MAPTRVPLRGLVSRFSDVGTAPSLVTGGQPRLPVGTIRYHTIPYLGRLMDMQADASRCSISPAAALAEPE